MFGPQPAQEDVNMADVDTNAAASKDEDTTMNARPHWMKSKLPGGETC